MQKLKLYLRKLFMPQDDETLSSDITVLAVCIFTIVTSIVLLIIESNESVEYECAGPGFADFGCNGGMDALIVNSISFVLFAIFLASFVISFNRFIYRLNMKKKSRFKR